MNPISNLRATILLGLILGAWAGLAHPAAGFTRVPQSVTVIAPAADPFAAPVVAGVPACEIDGETLANGTTPGAVRPQPTSPPTNPEARIRPAEPAAVSTPARGRLPDWTTTLPPPA